MGRSCGRLVAMAVVLVALAGCGSSAPGAPAASVVPSTTTITAPTSTVASTTIAPATTSSALRAAVPDAALDRAAGAGQVIVVTADRYGATTATLTAYQREGAGWKQAFGPWAARLGTRGLAPPGEKWEGDGRTPSGVYGFDFFFGVAPDPGVRFPYRRVTPRIVWDDDPVSPLYNTWVDLDRQQAGPSPEPMYVSPAYDHGAVIAYNTDRTPGVGSAIFLHVSTGGPTAGCVSLPAGQLVDVLRWLDPARTPKIVLGVSS